MNSSIAFPVAEPSSLKIIGLLSNKDFREIPLSGESWAPPTKNNLFSKSGRVLSFKFIGKTETKAKSISFLSKDVSPSAYW